MDVRGLVSQLKGLIDEFDPARALSVREISLLLTAPPGRLPLTRDLLRPGNDKLSKKILTFGLPAVLTCPGKSELCGGEDAVCYATHYHYKQGNVVRPRLENFVLANREDFADLIVRELPLHKSKVIRPHDSGDLFSRAYALSWLDIFRRTASSHRHFIFSRSWRVEGVVEVLEQMTHLKNVRVWYSVDRETGWPCKIPAAARLTYMQVDEADRPERPVDLVFRDYGVRAVPAKRVAGTLVCPYENGITRDPHDPDDEFNCFTCGMCWEALDTAKDPRRHHGHRVVGTRRRPLKLLATV